MKCLVKSILLAMVLSQFGLISAVYSGTTATVVFSGRMWGKIEPCRL